MDFNSVTVWPLVIAGSLLIILARSLRIPIWKAVMLLGMPASVFITLTTDNPTEVREPLIGAAVAWLALALVLRIPVRIAFTLVLIPLIFGGMAVTIAMVVLSDTSLLGSTQTITH